MKIQDFSIKGITLEDVKNFFVLDKDYVIYTDEVQDCTFTEKEQIVDYDERYWFEFDVEIGVYDHEVTSVEVCKVIMYDELEGKSIDLLQHEDASILEYLDKEVAYCVC